MTDAAPPEFAAPPGPAPVTLLIANDLVTRYRLRISDQRDARLGPLLGGYQLAAAMWTGTRAALVALYDPPADPAEAGRDLAARCDAARRWGEERLRVQGAEVCDILLVALRPLAGSLVASTIPGDRIRLGVAWVDTTRGEAGSLLAPPPGLPPVAELRARARGVHDGTAVPTLAAVDLAERQAVAGGYVAPVRRAMVSAPYVTYAFIATFVVIFIAEMTAIRGPAAVDGDGLCAFGALTNAPGPGCELDWWRFVSSAFLHDNLGFYHVLLNSFAMLFIGRLVEQLYGRIVLAGTFLLTAAAGGLLWIAATQLPLNLPGIAAGVSIGASGGISGLVGLLLVLGRVQGRNVPVGIAHTVRNYALSIIVINVAFTFLLGASIGINNYAHLGGVIAGALIGLVLPPRQQLGGRDLHISENVVLWATIAAGAVALLLAALNLAQSAGAGMLTG